MDAYFAEGEAKSKEQDFAPSPKKGAVAPPPPKAGEPPFGGPKRESSPLKQDSAETSAEADEPKEEAQAEA